MFLPNIVALIVLSFVGCNNSSSHNDTPQVEAQTDPCNPQPPPAGDGAKAVMAEINKVRAQRGLSQIQELQALNCAALSHAKDIGARKICSHRGADGSSPWDRAKACGTVANGEIVACGHQSAAAAVVGWTNSPGHAAIMFDPAQKQFGAGMVNNYWVVIFRK
jgi:uncharacterized protein YkwD